MFLFPTLLILIIFFLVFGFYCFLEFSIILTMKHYTVKQQYSVLFIGNIRQKFALLHVKQKKYTDNIPTPNTRLQKQY